MEPPRDSNRGLMVSAEPLLHPLFVVGRQYFQFVDGEVLIGERALGTTTYARLYRAFPTDLP
jgi:hypothetical protein